MQSCSKEISAPGKSPMNRTARRTHLSLRIAVSLSAAKKTGQLRGFHQRQNKNQLPVSPWHFDSLIHAPKETKCEVNLEGLYAAVLPICSFL
jgi:hypothetical protein